MKFKNYINSRTGNDKIYSDKNFTDMTLREIFNNREELIAQHKVLGFPNEAELAGSGNVVHVEAYTREDGTEVKAHWRSKPNSGNDVKEGSTTGAAAGIDDGRSMNILSQAQVEVIKLDPSLVARNYPEQEYYKIANALSNVSDISEVPKWVKTHNDVYQVKDISDNNLADFVKTKIINSSKNSGVIDKSNDINDTVVIQPKENSNISNILTKSPELHELISKHYQEIYNGKFEHNGSLSMEFSYANISPFDEQKKFSLYNTIKKCDIYDIKPEGNGVVSMKIVDYYDFSPKGGFLNDNAYRQQENGKLSNYVLIVPIKIKLKCYENGHKKMLMRSK